MQHQINITQTPLGTILSVKHDNLSTCKAVGIKIVF